MQNLRSYGCSFIYGTDLADCVQEGPNATASNVTWPALLAKRANLNYICNAIGGSGNLHILEKLLRDVTSNPRDFYVVQWSWVDRFDYTDTDFDRNDHWYTLTPTNNSDVAHTYYKKLHSEVKDKFSSLVYISTAISALTAQRTPFIMTCMDDLVFDSRWNAPDSTRHLQHSTHPYISRFGNKTFLDFSKANKFPISKTLHPLEDAHTAAASEMHGLFDSKMGSRWYAS